MMEDRGVNSLIADNNAATVANIQAFVEQLAASLENDPDNLGLLLSLKTVHNALSILT